MDWIDEPHFYYGIPNSQNAGIYSRTPIPILMDLVLFRYFLEAFSILPKGNKSLGSRLFSCRTGGGLTQQIFNLSSYFQSLATTISDFPPFPAFCRLPVSSHSSYLFSELSISCTLQWLSSPLFSSSRKMPTYFVHLWVFLCFYQCRKFIHFSFFFTTILMESWAGKPINTWDQFVFLSHVIWDYFMTWSGLYLRG